MASSDLGGRRRQGEGGREEGGRGRGADGGVTVAATRDVAAPAREGGVRRETAAPHFWLGRPTGQRLQARRVLLAGRRAAVFESAGKEDGIRAGVARARGRGKARRAKARARATRRDGGRVGDRDEDEQQGMRGAGEGRRRSRVRGSRRRCARSEGSRASRRHSDSVVLRAPSACQRRRARRELDGTPRLTSYTKRASLGDLGARRTYSSLPGGSSFL